MEAIHFNACKCEGHDLMPSVRNRVTVIAAFALVVISVLATSAFRRTPMERLRSEAESLSHRSVRGRLSGFSHEPFVNAGSDMSATNEFVPLRSSAFQMIGQPADSPEKLHARGIARLLSGDPAGAVNDLGVARTEQPWEARTLSDFSVAVMERAFREDNAELMIEALTAADQAVDLDPKLPEAVFNRAMALEGIGLRPAADKAFQHYIALDPSSSWADEARSHLSRRKKTKAAQWETVMVSLEHCASDGSLAEVAAIVKRFPQEARTWGEGEYLARWAEAVERNDEPAAKHWGMIAQRVGDALQTLSGEALLHDAAAVARDAHGARMIRLARAHLIYRQARILYGQRRVADAGPQFENAAREFAGCGTPMADVVAYYLANVAYDHSDAAGCLAQLAAVDQRTPAKYAALKAEILWTRASALARVNRLYESIEASRSALSLFERLGERDNLTSVQSSTAATLSHLGRDFEAWKIRRAVFQSASDSGRAYVLELAVAGAARTAVRGGRNDIARTLLGAQLELPSDSSRVRFDAVLWHTFAVAQGKNRPFNVAERGTIDRAALGIADTSLRRDALDEGRLAEAIALRKYDAARALALLDATLAERVSRHRPLEVPRIQLERARALRDIGRRAEAEATLYQAINLIEGQKENIPQLDLRDSYLGASDASFTELADLLFADRNVAGGFDAVERARGQAITERLALAHPPTPGRLDDVTRRLPDGVALLEWVATSNRTWAVMISRHAWRSAAIPVSQTELRRRAANLRHAIESGDDVTTSREGKALYAVLFSALLPSRHGFQTLVIVPDPAMDSIPFAVLRDPVSGKLLIEDEDIVTAPSSAAYLTSRDRTPLPLRPPWKAVLLGDPMIAELQFASLPRLPDAANEIRLIARMYPEAIAKSGLSASRRWFMEECNSSDVVHVAAHAVLNIDEPWLSVLPLAGDRGDDGLLYVRDIANMQLQKSPIVILAGCKTAASVNGHAVLHNLALAFLAAGARSVAGTLWDVDDHATRAFSLSLHHELSRGSRPAEAIRSAQLAMLHSADPTLRRPRTWGAFQLYGSDR